MERDFLGMGGKDCEPTGSCCNDSAFLASSGVQRPFPGNMSNLQQFMSFKAVAHEDRLKENVYDQYPSSRFHSVHPMGSVDATHRQSPLLLSQKSFGMDGQGTHLFPLPVYPSSLASNSYGTTAVHHSSVSVSGDARMFPTVSNQSIPMAQGNFFRGPGSGNIPSSCATPLKQQQPSGGRSRVAAPVNRSTDAAFTPRNSTISVPATAQLTIFYGGAVNVYDNVPIEKAQSIMFLASNSSNMCSTPGKQRDQTPLLVSNKAVEVEPLNINKIQQHTNVASPCSAFSSPMSVASHSTDHSGSGSSSHDDKWWQKTSAPPVAKGQSEPLKTMVPAVEPATNTTLMTRAVPMARKASLARFLEKRKERVSNATPYASQKTIECGSVSDITSFPGKPMSALEKSLPGSGEHSWSVGSPKFTTNDAKPPNTRLQI